jgi:HEPN domain-containing protein
VASYVYVAADAPTIARTWLEEAEADLRAAELSLGGGAYNWACFQAQQAGEKALKAYLYARGRTSIVTHSLRRLLAECERTEPAFAQLGKAGKLLDDHYIPTRYPNGLDEEMAPSRYYLKEDAEECLRSARSILERVRRSFVS